MKLNFSTPVLLMTTLIFFGVDLMAQTEITLNPGASILVQAGDNANVSCSGSTRLGNPDCTIVKREAQDKYGNTCNSSYYKYCAHFYSFDAMIEASTSDDVGSLSNWCKRRIQSQ